jgi:hypothetical protein
LKRVGAKGEFWLFVGKVIDLSFGKIALPDTCEIVDDCCDNCHRAWAHTRRRQDIRRLDWKYAFRVLRACQECHYFADALQGGRTNSETFLEAIRAERNKRLGLTEADIEGILLQCAAQIQKEFAPQYDIYHVEF